jgi:hypothetical protein
MIDPTFDVHLFFINDDEIWGARRSATCPMTRSPMERDLPPRQRTLPIRAATCQPFSKARFASSSC